jgi:hypothetical protein
VVAVEPGQHRLVPVGVEDAVHDGVEAVIQRVAGHLIDQPDVRPARPVLLLQAAMSVILKATGRPDEAGGRGG